jgi:hypothetical protein
VTTDAVTGWVILLGFVSLMVLLGWLTVRWTKQPPTAPDLRRADEAEAEAMPTAAEMQDRIGEAFGRTRPLP